MGIRIQPRDIEVPEDDPFKNDLLGRREAVDTPTHLVGNLEGPCVLAVDAAWGAGKTTFLKIWAQYLRNQGFSVVEFNAWETDFSEDPFVTLSSELMESLRQQAGKSLGGMIGEFKKAAKEVLRHIAPGAIRVATATIPIVGSELGIALASYAKERLSQHQEARKSVKAFQSVLQEMAHTLSNERDGRPLILMIDELDRCRPSYAVELLEVAKHLFSVDRIVFVLPVNRDQLEHSVRALYGSDFDAEGYLRRFFDVDFQLPEPSRDAFIAAQLRATGIADYFDQTPEKPSYFYPVYFPKEVERKKSGENLRVMLETFFGTSDLSLRTVGQAIHRLGLLFASLGNDQHDHALATTVALILRTVDPKLYDRFVNGEVSDADVVDAVFGRPGLKALQHQESRFVFEAVIVLAGHKAPPGRPPSIYRSPLLRRYCKQLEEALPDSTQPVRFDDQQLLQAFKNLVDAGNPAAHEPQRKHAYSVFTKVRCFLQTTPIGFREAVQRIELLPTALIDNQTDPASPDS